MYRDFYMWHLIRVEGVTCARRKNCQLQESMISSYYGGHSFWRLTLTANLRKHLKGWMFTMHWRILLAVLGGCKMLLLAMKSPWVWAWDDDIISDFVKEIGKFFSIFQNLFLTNTRAKDTIGGLVFLRLYNNSMSWTFSNNNIAK